MKVAILGSGRSYHATRWANGLAGLGVDVLFITIHGVERPLDEAVAVYRLGGGRKYEYPIAAFRAASLLARTKPDLVHAHYATGYGVMGRLCGFRPLIVSVYGADVFDFPNRSILHHRILGSVLTGATKVLSTSHAMARQCTSTYPALPSPEVTPFGVDLDRFSPAEDREAEGEGLRVAVVKKLEPKYGIDILLEAVHLLVSRNEIPEISVNIVGDGQQRERLEAMAERLDIDSNVRFLGRLPNAQVPAILKSADVAAVASRSESFGVAAVEAQACGVPVIASSVGGLPEVVEDGVSGVIVQKEDPEALARALVELHEDRARLRRMGQAARDRVRKHYDWSRNLRHMVDIYRSVLEVEASE